MGIEAIIRDPREDRGVGVGIDGRLFTGPSSFSMTFNGELGTVDTPVNIVPAKASRQFIITDIILVGNKSINTNVDAVVTIYEASSATSATQDQVITTLPVARGGQITMNGIFLGGGEAVYINGTTSDDDVFVSIFGFYVKV